MLSVQLSDSIITHAKESFLFFAENSAVKQETVEITIGLKRVKQTAAKEDAYEA